MNVYVSVDMEGITGIVHGDMMMPSEREYDRGRRLMTGDANAAVEGLHRAGAEHILVADGHGPMRNIFFEDLSPHAHLMTGSANARDYCQLQGADSRAFDAAVFVGYHAMAKTMEAIHPHTIAGVAIHELRINGRPHGETGLNAAVLGSLGIPVIMVTGDLTTTREAVAFLGEQIATVAVKQATGRNAAICYPASITRAEITAAAERALHNLASMKPYVPGGGFLLEVDFLTMQQAERAGRTQGIERIGPVTISVLGADPWEQYRNLWAGLRSALYEPASWLA
jgi:D-amino peptidase